jgi:hypothetical protein
MPSVDPAMPRSITAGLSRMLTVAKRDSKRPEAFWMKRGCAVSGRPRHGSQPSRANSWQPLQTPSEKVLGRS